MPNDPQEQPPKRYDSEILRESLDDILKADRKKETKERWTMRMQRLRALVEKSREGLKKVTKEGTFLHENGGCLSLAVAGFLAIYGVYEFKQFSDDYHFRGNLQNHTPSRQDALGPDDFDPSEDVDFDTFTWNKIQKWGKVGEIFDRIFDIEGAEDFCEDLASEDAFEEAQESDQVEDHEKVVRAAFGRLVLRFQKNLNAAASATGRSAFSLEETGVFDAPTKMAVDRLLSSSQLSFPKEGPWDLSRLRDPREQWEASNFITSEVFRGYLALFPLDEFLPLISDGVYLHAGKNKNDFPPQLSIVCLQMFLSMTHTISEEESARLRNLGEQYGKKEIVAVKRTQMLNGLDPEAEEVDGHFSRKTKNSMLLSGAQGYREQTGSPEDVLVSSAEKKGILIDFLPEEEWQNIRGVFEEIVGKFRKKRKDFPDYEKRNQTLQSLLLMTFYSGIQKETAFEAWAYSFLDGCLSETFEIKTPKGFDFSEKFEKDPAIEEALGEEILGVSLSDVRRRGEVFAGLVNSMQDTIGGEDPFYRVDYGQRKIAFRVKHERQAQWDAFLKEHCNDSFVQDSAVGSYSYVIEEPGEIFVHLFWIRKEKGMYVMIYKGMQPYPTGEDDR